jgi:hypothetical protein
MTDLERFENWFAIELEKGSLYLADKEDCFWLWQAAKESQWQPIETAPKDGDCILLLSAHKGEGVSYRVAYWDEEGRKYFQWHVDDSADGFNHHDNFFTHWMPLPQPPKAMSKKG